MFRLHSLTLRNWATIAAAQIDFPKSGLVFVQGISKNAGVFVSSGAGKSMVGNAIARTTFGIPGPYTHISGYARNERAGGTGADCYSRVVGELHGKELVIEAGYRCKELSLRSEGLKFTYDGKETQRAKNTDTRIELDRLLGLDSDLSSCTIHLNGKLLNFQQKPKTELVDLLMRALAYPSWDSLADTAKQVLRQNEGTLETAVSNHQLVTRQLTAAARDVSQAENELNHAKVDYDTALADYSEALTRATNKVEQALAATKKTEQAYTNAAAVLSAAQNALLDSVTKQQTAANEARAKLNELETQKDKAQQEYTDAYSALTSKKLTLSNKKVDLDAHSTGKCPKCKQPWVDPHAAELEAAVAAAEQAVEKAEQRVSTTKEIVEKLVEKVRACRNEYSGITAAKSGDLAKLRADAKTTKADYDDALDALDTATAAKTRLVEPKDPRPVKQALLEERRARLTSLEDQSTELSQDIAVREQAVTVAKYWYAGFGPNGLPSLALNDQLPALNAAAARISAMLTKGGINITFATSKQLVSGASKSGLEIVVNNPYGASVFEGNSNGEASISNLLVAETLAEIGAMPGKVAYRFYDEVTPGQDPALSNTVFSYWRQLGRAMLVLSVEHNPALANFADHVLVVRKDEALTTVRWA